MVSTLTIRDIKNKLESQQEISEEFISQLKHDNRRGVQKLLDGYQRRQEKALLDKQLFTEMSTYERIQQQSGKSFIAGIDEAGRGPLAGPVVAAAVILGESFYLPGLNDSKQINERLRNEYYQIITSQAKSWAVGVIDNQEIDNLNIYQASKKAMHIALNNLKQQPDHVLIDAVPLERLPCTSEAIIKGDQKSISIAAASIVAKVTRDRMMADIHADYPLYDFITNQGYGTKAHITALHKHGITPYHRKSFAPIRELITK
ncbi:ribonuclease HII [Sediminibacillus albus]|uniref:Ribonuclease HII n=1 Tax=Sediminibacillus albus TaxID=407036 RepID=A0A1G8W3A3_9BACI|nr:ribonuclease HII [Sediminibacillus albus]SDJ72782.1 RNase HII [Sediminibacillus albus]